MSQRLASTSAPRTRAAARAGAFTLIELIVVIGVIALLIGLLLPAISMVRGSARESNVRATLSSISNALEAYRQDFGDYPRFGLNNVDPLNFAEDRGARLLARALIGPAPASHGTPDPPAADPRYLFQDGHGTPNQPLGLKGERQRVQRGTEFGFHYPGPVRGPYLDAERFLVRKTGDSSLVALGYVYGPDAVILDPRTESPILYYPARQRQPDIATTAARLDAGGTPTVGLYVDEFNEVQRQQSLYNAFDNRFDSISGDALLAMPDLRLVLGDFNQDGVIGAGEQAATTGPFLLIAKGDMGNYVEEPVANFDVPKRK